MMHHSMICLFSSIFTKSASHPTTRLWASTTTKQPRSPMRKLRSRSPQRSSSPTPTIANSDVMADSKNEVIELQDVEKDKEKETDAGGDEENGGEDSNDSDEEDSSLDVEGSCSRFSIQKRREMLSSIAFQI
ncbi:hypothetical protein L208DRAFT_1402068 [Tricholoma matsutake]|nr:hypothetical protein L208DRAFT_1402068 [Tricholoma matsutake 945]